ncbi:MAG: TPM domain-containing protein [Deltaproteobacteria bacterium]|nr:TPM domain-containing protein [Deltaproteobacteria bacterium]
MRSKEPKKFFSPEESAQIVAAIEQAEKLTSGEIRVHLERKIKSDAFEEAKRVFEKLGMTKTAERNGILFFLSLKDKRFALLGDRGIHEKVASDFWKIIRDEVLQNFKEEKYVEGLVAGIAKCGAKLAEHFPYQANDQNELSNEISCS